MRERNGNFVKCLFLICACTIALGGFSYAPELANASSSSVPDIKIAVVYPLSGALSRNGHLMVEGIKAAMGWVNDNGGIKSLGGAKLVPVIGDSGTSVEGAASAMDRVCRNNNIVMAMGCWASSFTLAATEITERLGIPQFSISFSDALTNRGFKWGFYLCPPSSVFGSLGVSRVIDLARSLGHNPRTAVLVSDNQAASRAHCAAVRKLFSKMGIKILAEEVFTMGTLTDATPIMQKVKSCDPDIVIFAPSSIHEAQLLLMKKRELGITVPFIGSTGADADPSFLQVGAKYLEGLTTITSSFPHKLTPKDWIKRALEQCRQDYSNEPYAGQELMYGWSMVPIMAEILERAGSRNHEVIRETAQKLDIHNVLATRATAGQGMAFDGHGRIAKKYQNVLVVQWQNGIPKTVYPNNLALAKPVWIAK